MRIGGSLFRKTVRGGIKKFVQLVSKPIEYVRHITDNVIIVIMHGRYIMTAREQQETMDSIRTIKFQTVEIRLDETQSSADGISSNQSVKITRSIEETQQSQDLISESTSSLVVRSYHEMAGQAYDNIGTAQAELKVLTYAETTGQAYDSVSTQTATLTVLTFDESQQTQDSQSQSEASKVWKIIREKQYSHEISTAYVPQGNETLVITVKTEVQHSYDSITAETAPASTSLDVTEWYAEYQTTVILNYSEEQDTSDVITPQTATLQTLNYSEEQDTSDEISVSIGHVFAGLTGEWYAEYQTTVTLNYTEEQDSSDALTYETATLQTLTLSSDSQDSSDALSYYSTTTDTSAIDGLSEWYAEYVTG